MSDRFIPVPFRTETLYVLDHDGQPYVPLRPIVEGMGLQWSAQLAKLKGVSISTHLRARYHHMVIPLPTPGGLQETICLPLRKLNGWLFSINPEKVKPELRDTIIAYQEECFEALYAYWHHGSATRENADADATEDAESDVPTLAGTPRSRFAALEANVMRELRRVNPLLVQAYLVDHGITPAFVDELLQNNPLLPAAPSVATDNILPLDKLLTRLPHAHKEEDDRAWYLRRGAWLQLCENYDPRATASWYAAVGVLRTNTGRLTFRAPTHVFNGLRPPVICIDKTALSECAERESLRPRPPSAAQQPRESGGAHVQ